MIPWEKLDSVPTPTGETLTLHRRGKEYSIRIGYDELMNSRMHGSEEAMADLACDGLAEGAGANVLIGGLGMGFTLSACNRVLPTDARIEVAELVPTVVEWNRGPLGECAGHPLADPRVLVTIDDVCAVIRRATGAYDAILLDVDNGPEGLTQDSNGWLYQEAGLRSLKSALRPGGTLCIWSAGDDPRFTRRLQQNGYRAQAHMVRARKGGKGPKHTIWVAVSGR
ncbi:MAG: spermidine synthase [Bradymonadia bacterium]